MEGPQEAKGGRASGQKTHGTHGRTGTAGFALVGLCSCVTERLSNEPPLALG